MLPEESWGWLHTPGLSGSRGGRDNFTRFDAASVEQTHEGEGDASVQRVVVQAADAVAELALTVTIELLGSGLVRARASIASSGNGSSEERAVPGGTADRAATRPSRSDRMLTSPVGGFESASPQRTAFNTGTHLREARRGKPGHDSAFLIAAGASGFGFRSGEVWLTHVGWSGNSRHLAERANDG